MKVKVDRISLKYRHDVAFFIHVLTHQAWPEFYEWHDSCDANKRRKRRDKLKGFWNAKTSETFRESVPLYEVDGVLHPAGGAKRIATAYARGLKTIKAKVIGDRIPDKYIAQISADSKLGKLSASTQKIIQTRIEITELLRDSRFGEYQEVPELSIRGARVEAINRLKGYGCFDKLKGKKVLDIGCNMGMLTLQCARQAQSVVGIDPLDPNAKVASILRDFYGLTNATFAKQSFLDHCGSDHQYDVILAIAVHNWVHCDLDDFFLKMRNMLTPNGLIIFESHKGQTEKLLKRQIEKTGFTTHVQKSNQKRRFVFRCVKS